MTASANNELAILLYTRQADGHWQYSRKLLGIAAQRTNREWMAADDHVVAALFDRTPRNRSAISPANRRPA
jgi:hypothetical protein